MRQRHVLIGCVGAALMLAAGRFGLDAAAQGTGTIHGLVSVDTVPEKMMVAVTADQAVCGEEVEDRGTVVDSAGGVKNAVVVLTGVAWPEPPPAGVINNKACYFEPRVQVARTGSQIDVTSEDNTLHTTHAYDDRQRTLFNIALPVAGMTVKRPLRRPGPLRVECDSHGWMRGWVYITDDLAVVTGDDGRFELSGVPPGTYELAIWHERYTGVAQSVTVTGGGAVEASFILE